MTLLKTTQDFFSARVTGLKAGVNEILDELRGIPMPRRRSLVALSDHAELHSTGFADHVLVPRRVPNELHVSFIDAIYAEDFALRIVRDCRSHSATRRGQSHFYFHARPAIVLFRQATIVHQAKIDDVNWNLWVITLPELVPDIFL